MTLGAGWSGTAAAQEGPRDEADARLWAEDFIGPANPAAPVSRGDAGTSRRTTYTRATQQNGTQGPYTGSEKQ